MIDIEIFYTLKWVIPYYQFFQHFHFVYIYKNVCIITGIIRNVDDFFIPINTYLTEL